MTGRTRPLQTVPGLLELADRQCGIVRRSQLAELGVTHHHVRRQLDAQRWQAIGPRLVAVLTGALVAEQRRWAGQLHVGLDSVLHGRTALEHVGMVGWEVDLVHIARAHDDRVPRLAGVVSHRLRTLDQSDVRLVRGLRCHAPARAAVEAAAAERNPRTAAGLVHAVVQQRLTTGAEIVRCLDRTPLVRHAQLLRAAAGAASSGSESVSEADVVRLVRRAGLPAPRRQVVIRTPDGERRYDLVVDLPDGSFLVIEVDGPHHHDPRVAAADAIKDAAVLAAGGRVLHIPWHLVRTDPQRIVRQLQDIARAAGGWIPS
jgi:hypothetical protein